MGAIRDTVRRLAADGRIGAEEAKQLVAAVKADKTVSAEEKAELNQVLARFADAFDAAGWKVLADDASLGMSVKSEPLAPNLQARPELKDIAAGRKTLSTANRKDAAAVHVQRALMTLARLEGKPAFALPGAGADGDFGAESTSALKAFQASRNLPATGAVDAATLEALSEALTRGGQTPAKAKAFGNERFKGDETLGKVLAGQLSLAPGAKGEPVKKVQQALVDLGYPMPEFGVDGDFGGELKRGLTEFQRDQKLPVTGRVDASTIEALDKVSKAPGEQAVRYPEYDKMFKDGVLEVDLGIGFDEDGSDLYERRVVQQGLAARGFVPLDPAKLTDAQLKEKGLDPAKLDREAKYFLGTFKANGKDVKALVKYTDRDTPKPKEKFARGFAQADLVMYGGHARYGSGPDFDVKESTDGNFVLGVNSDAHKKGLAKPSYDAHMREILKDSKNDLEATRLTDDYQLMFFSGCTTRHYLDELRTIPKNKSAENLDFVGSNDVLLWNNIGGNVLDMLDGVMGGKSINDIQAALYARNQVSFTADGFGGNSFHP